MRKGSLSLGNLSEPLEKKLRRYGKRQIAHDPDRTLFHAHQHFGPPRHISTSRVTVPSVHSALGSFLSSSLSSTRSMSSKMSSSRPFEACCSVSSAGLNLKERGPIVTSLSHSAEESQERSGRWCAVPLVLLDGDDLARAAREKTAREAAGSRSHLDHRAAPQGSRRSRQLVCFFARKCT